MKIKQYLRVSSCFAGLYTTLAFGIFSIFSVLIGAYIDKILEFNYVSLIIGVAFLVVFLVVFSAMVTNIIARYYLDVFKYADAIGGGLTEPQLLAYIATRSKDIHKRFNKKLRPFIRVYEKWVNIEGRDFSKIVEGTPDSTSNLQILDDLKGDWSRGGDRVTAKCIKSMTRFKRRSFRDREINKCLVDQLSERTNIPSQRIERHIIQYSPSACDENINRVISSMQSFSEILSAKTDYFPELPNLMFSLIERLYGLSSKCDEIYKSSMKRISISKELTVNKNSLADILILAGCSSSTKAILLYSTMLSKVAKAYVKSFKGGVDANRIIEFDGLKPYYLVIRFCCRKQKAYPGYDPHKLLIHFLKEECFRADPSQSMQIANLKYVIVFLEFVEAGLHKNVDEYLSDCKARCSSFSNDEIRSHLTLLMEFSGIMDTFMSYRKRELVDSTRSELASDMLSLFRGDKMLLITHGYSRSVRQVLKKSFQAIDGNSAKISVFILESTLSSEDESDQMRRDLSSKHLNGLPHIEDVTVGDFSLLNKLYNPRWIDSAFVLLGAECVDSYGYAITAKGTNQILDFFNYDYSRSGASTNQMLSVKPPVWICVEDFRTKIDSVFEIGPLEDHFDRIDIVSPNSYDSVLSNSSVNGEILPVLEKYKEDLSSQQDVNADIVPSDKSL